MSGCVRDFSRRRLGAGMGWNARKREEKLDSERKRVVRPTGFEPVAYSSGDCPLDLIVERFMRCQVCVTGFVTFTLFSPFTQQRREHAQHPRHHRLEDTQRFRSALAPLGAPR